MHGKGQKLKQPNIWNGHLPGESLEELLVQAAPGRNIACQCSTGSLESEISI
jgi:hypothetical protein